MHVVNLASSVNDPPRVRRPKRRVSVSPWEAQFRLHNRSWRSARDREKSVNGEMFCPGVRAGERGEQLGETARREFDHSEFTGIYSLDMYSTYKPSSNSNFQITMY